MNALNRLRSSIPGRGRPSALDAMPPWMAPEEFSQLRAVVQSLRPRRVLEWGAGGSTRALLADSPFIERYHAIEHDEAWARRVRDQSTDMRLTVHWVAPDLPPPTWPRERKAFKDAEKAWHDACERDPAIMASYVAHAATLEPDGFEFILVDGRARVFCLDEAWKLIQPGGAIVVHDAQRSAYHPTLERLGQPIFLDPWSQGQICLLVKPRA